MMPDTRLAKRLREHIAEAGPMSVADYMRRCLMDPVDGFYPTRDPLGSDGEFHTAPEMSALFSDCLGLWVIKSWDDLGQPDAFNLIELGPGSGTMMADMLNIIATQPACYTALRVVLVEASPALQSVQGRSLELHGVPVTWADQLDDVDLDIPSLIVGNEFLDCLPIQQFVYDGQKTSFWRERKITCDEEFKFADNTCAPHVEAASFPEPARAHDIFERRPAISDLIENVSDRFLHRSGRALFIDYGHTDAQTGETLKAHVRNETVDIFEAPGRCVLTADVDFADMKQKAEAAGLSVSGPIAQSKFLNMLGIESRAVNVLRETPEARPRILSELFQLLDNDKMGARYKAICLSSSDLPPVLGFPE